MRKKLSSGLAAAAVLNALLYSNKAGLKILIKEHGPGGILPSLVLLPLGAQVITSVILNAGGPSVLIKGLASLLLYLAEGPRLMRDTSARAQQALADRVTDSLCSALEALKRSKLTFSVLPSAAVGCLTYALGAGRSKGLVLAQTGLSTLLVYYMGLLALEGAKRGDEEARARLAREVADAFARARAARRRAQRRSATAGPRGQFEGANPLIGHLRATSTFPKDQLACIAKGAREAIQGNRTIPSIIESMVASGSGIIAGKLRPLSEGFNARANHMFEMCKKAEGLGTLLDFEEINTGSMLAPADLVYVERNFVVLEDLTTDGNLQAQKMLALQARCNKLEKSFGCRVAVPRVSIIPRTIVLLQETIPTGNQEPEMFTAMADLGEAVSDAMLCPEPYLKALEDSVTYSTAVTRPLSDLQVDKFTRIATGLQARGDVEELLESSSEFYPILAKTAKGVFENVWSNAKGLPPPSLQAKPLDKDSESWAGLLGLAKTGKDGDLFGWNEGGRPERTTNTLSHDVVLRRVEGSYFQVSVLATAPQEWKDLVNRKGGGGGRDDLEQISPERADEIYAIGNAFLERMGDEYAVGAPSMVSGAAALVKKNLPETGPERVAAEAAVPVLEAVTKTLGFQVLSTSQAVISSGALAASAGKRNLFRLCEFYGGRVLTLTQKTGDLSNDNDTRLIAAVSDPVGPMLSWEAKRDRGFSLSKCIFASSRLRNHLDACLGRAPMVAFVYADGCTDGLVGVQAAATFSTTCIGANKEFGIAMSNERGLSEGVCAIANSTDEVAKKMANHKPRTLAEATVLARVLLRCLACAMIRDTGTLADIVKKNNAGSVSPIYVPAYAPRGKFSFTGMINSVYDYHAGSPEAPSVIRNEARAFVGVFGEVEDFVGRVESGEQSVWCMSKETLAAWRSGNIREFVKTPEFEKAECGFLRYITGLGKRHTCSIALMASFAARYSRDKSLPPLVAQCVEEVSKEELKAYISNKSACESANVGEDRASSPAYKTLTRMALNLAGGHVPEFKVNSMWGAMRTFGRRMTHNTTVLSVLSMVKNQTFYVIAKAKDLTVEKVRDFFMMAAEMRVTQGVTEKLSKRLGNLLEWSFLNAASKIQAVNNFIDIPLPPGMFVVATMTDKTRYGPSRIPGGLYSVAYAVGLRGGMKELYRYTMSKMMRKRVRPSDQLLAAEAPALRDAEVAGAEGLADYLSRSLLSPDNCLEVPSGTGAGLTQSTSDLFTAVATGITEEIIKRKTGFCKAASTNDDGVTITRTFPAQAWQHAADVATATIQTGYATGECSNKTKVIGSTWGVNLNTQFRPLGDMVGQGRGALPWARTLFSLTGPSAQASLKESALEALSATNSAVDEGAPHFALIGASAIAHASHYMRFRHLDSARNGDFLGAVPSTLGPPIFFPYGVRRLGGAAVEIAYESLRTGRPCVELAQSSVAKQVLTSTQEIGSLEWTASEGPAAQDVGYEDYYLYTMPSSRIRGDQELGELVQRISEPDYGKETVPRSLEESIAERLLELRDFSVENLVKPTSLSVAWAASSYALSKQRVRVVSAKINGGVVERESSSISLSEMKKRLGEGRPDFPITGVGAWGITKKLSDDAEFIRDYAKACPKTFRTVATLQRYYVRRVHLGCSSLSKEEEAALRVMVAPPKLKGGVALESARSDGILVAPFIPVEELPSMKEKVAIKTATTRLISRCYRRAGPPVIVNESVNSSTLSEYLLTASCADIGVTMRLTPQGPFKKPDDPSTRATQTSSTISRRIANRVGKVIAEASLLRPCPPQEARSLRGVADGPGRVVLEEGGGGPVGTLAPNSSHGLADILLSFADFKVYVNTSDKLIKACRGRDTSGCLRRHSEGKSIARKQNFVITGEYGPLDYLATETRLDNEDGSYARVVNIYLESRERVLSIGIATQAGVTPVLPRDEGAGRYYSESNGKLTEVFLTRGAVRGSVSIEAYPPCYVFTPSISSQARAGGMAILSELKPGTVVTSRIARIRNIPERREADNREREAAARVANLITSLVGIGPVLATKGTSVHPKDVVHYVFSEITRVDREYMGTNAFSDARQAILDFMQLGQEDVLASMVASILVASDYFGGKYGIIPGSDGGDLKRHIRYALYTADHITKEEGQPKDEFPEVLDFESMTLQERVQAMTALMEEAAAGDMEDGIGSQVEFGFRFGNEDLGGTDEGTAGLIAAALGLDPATIEAEVFTTSPVRTHESAADHRPAVLAVGSPRHRAFIAAMADCVCDHAVRSSVSAAGVHGTSAICITSTDRLSATAGADAGMVGSCGDHQFAYASIVGLSQDSQVLLRARERASAAARSLGYTEAMAPMGLGGYRAITLEEARQLHLLRSVSPSSIRRRVIHGVQIGDDLSEITFIGSYGEVSMGVMS